MNIEKEKVTNLGTKIGQICAAAIGITVTACILALLIGITTNLVLRMF